MGAAIGGVGSCLGSCAGGLVAGCCCKVAAAGRIDSTKGARMLLVYLQLFTVSLALIMGIHPWTWIGAWMCGIPGLSEVGLCACNDNIGDLAHTCWIDQTLYRVQCCGFLVFVGVALLTASGCSDSAAHGFPVLKFMLVIAFAFVFVFVPNPVFKFYAELANIMSTIFIAAQTILLVDFAYTWNESWMGNSLEARRRDISSRGGYKNWKIGILISSALLFLGSTIACICLWANFDFGWWVVFVALVLSLALGVVSILEAVKHGNLLSSCVVLAYVTWLCFEALLAHPENTNTRPMFLKWIGIGVAFLSLIASAFGSGLGFNKQGEPLVALEDGEANQEGTFDKTDFLIQSAIHATAALYITVEIAPRHSQTAFLCRTLGVFLALALYGWTLAAPFVLKGRDF